MYKYVNVHIKSLKCPINLIIEGVVVHTPTKLVVYIAKCLYNLLCKLEHHRLHTARVNQFFVHSENFGNIQYLKFNERRSPLTKPCKLSYCQLAWYSDRTLLQGC